VTSDPDRHDRSSDIVREEDEGVQARGTFSCVVDEHPRFHLDALRWFVSLTAIAGVDPRDLVVHVVGSDASDALGHLRSCGVTVRSIQPFDHRSPHCNKVAGALRLAEDQVEGMVVLCDTDVAVLEDPRTISVPPRSIGGKIVDTPVPPLEVIHGIFAAARVPAPPTTPLPWGDNEVTIVGNVNGGVYLIPAPLLPVVAAAWELWARWLLDRRELLVDWTFHLDQVAMALALAAEGIGSEQLDVRWNTPTHDLTRIPADPPIPAIIHYHQEIDPQGRIRTTGFPAIDQQIERVNEAIGHLWQEAFPNATFWQWRYLTDPELGSGIGSRGEPLMGKRELLATILDAIAPDSVVDVGCGDGEATRDLPMRGYVGIDLSAEAVRRAEIGRPDGTYLVGRLADFSIRADLTICLDVLIHQPDAAAYRDQVERVWQSAESALVISGYEQPLGTLAPMVHFHEPLSRTLGKVAPEAECYPVREEHGITTFVVLRPPPVPHPRDLRAATLASVIDRHPDPLTLMCLRVGGQRALGFFPDHAPLLWKYAVAADHVMEHLGAGSKLIDVGAGITPLAPFLTDRGYVVDTVDPSEIVRTWPPAEDWNEWGFLDYAEAGFGHRSWNCTLDQLPKSAMFDGVLSISVIEHIPATGRRALLEAIALRLRPGGLMVLTVDLTRGGLDLWNRNMGRVVDEPGRHGTFRDVITEGTAVGFDLVSSDVVREWGDVEVDIGLIVMRRKEPTVTSWRRAWRILHRSRRAAMMDRPALYD
jgi:2-polyprenyl-3-methyl-5-hydroxy-6-metoxy-1,4-benzoquinol methylase